MTVKKLLTPADFREYQPMMVEHLLEFKRSALWVDMGLGKTPATLTAIDALIMAGDDAPVLVLAPLRVAQTVWSEECAKWSHLKHLRISPILGTPKQRERALKYDCEIHTTNYESLPWLLEHMGDKWPWRTVIADESDKIKGFRLRQGGQRTAALGKVAHTKVDRFYELTGTPTPNSLEDLWGQLWYLDRGSRLGRTFDAFKQRWMRPNPNGYGSSVSPHAQGEIQELLKDICLTIDAADWFDLAEPIVTDIYVDLPAKVRQLYKDMEDDYFMSLESGHEIEAFSAAARSQKLLQCCSGAIYLNPEVEDDDHPKARAWKTLHDEKLDALDDIIGECCGSPIIVAYQHNSDLARLRKKYPHGKWLSDKKELAEFKTGKHPISFAHPASVGHGVDGLQHHCHRIVNFSQTWNLGHFQQLMARVGPVRQMQANTGKNVFIYNLIARDTMDEIVLERRDTKASVQDTLREAMKRRRKTP